MFCIKCGARLLEDAVFCSKCGNKILDCSPIVENEQVQSYDNEGEMNQENNFNKDNLQSLIVAIAKTDMFTEDSSCYVDTKIPRETLDNAMEAYGYGLNAHYSKVWFLCNDTFFSDAGTVGFLIDDQGIFISRGKKYLFSELVRISLEDDTSVKVTYRSCPMYSGAPLTLNTEEIYSIDTLGDDAKAKLVDLFGTLTDDVFLKE